MERGLNLQGHAEGAARGVPILLAWPSADLWDTGSGESMGSGHFPVWSHSPFQADLSHSGCRHSLSRLAPESVA